MKDDQLTIEERQNNAVPELAPPDNTFPASQ